jgi:hypothetical protein
MENNHIGISNGRWKQWYYNIGYFLPQSSRPNNKKWLQVSVHTAVNPIKGLPLMSGDKRNCNHDKERKMENRHIGKSNGR